MRCSKEDRHNEGDVVHAAFDGIVQRLLSYEFLCHKETATLGSLAEIPIPVLPTFDYVISPLEQQQHIPPWQQQDWTALIQPFFHYP